MPGTGRGESHQGGAGSQIGVLERGLVRTLDALRPYLTELVLIGGWVPYLYQRYGGFDDWTGRLLLTSEADLLVPRRVPPGARPTMADSLRAAGFRPTDSSMVWTGNPAVGERAEFLVAHVGTSKQLAQPVAIGGQPDLHALQLDHLAILGQHTTILPLGGDDESTRLAVRVPLLGAYVLQKAATFMQRTGTRTARSDRKAAKDLLYLRDVFAGGGAVTSRIEDEIKTLVAADADAPRLERTATQHLELVVGKPKTRLLAEAAAILHEREPEVSRDAANADVEGYLRDALDVLTGARPPRSARRSRP
jgi:hypothetical protein